MTGRLIKPLYVACCAVALALGLAACGDGSNSSGSSTHAAATAPATSASTAPGEGEGEGQHEGPGALAVIATVGSKPITRGQVSHWMATLAGGDYYELSHKNVIPSALVSDPPDYARCVAHLEAAAAAAPHKLYTVSNTQLLTKCRQLYSALRAQATGYLIKTIFVARLAEESGVSASDQEVQQFYDRTTGERFASSKEASEYLISSRASLADELSSARLELLSQRTLDKLKARGKSGVAQLIHAEARLRQETSCKPGYVVERCRQFPGQAPQSATTPPASVMIEQVAAIATGRCTNLAACGKA